MNRTRRPRFRVEQLEQRDCPSLTVFLSSSTLYVEGTPTANSTAGLQITQTANNTLNIKDNGHSLGTYAASSLTLSLTNHTGSPINIDLGGDTLTGNISVNLGTGDVSGVRSKGLAIDDGIVRGNVQVQGGSGNEDVLLGASTTDVPTNLTVGGSVSVTGKVTGNSSNVIGNLLDTGINAALTPPVSIGGNLTTTAYNGIGLTAETTIGGSVYLYGGGNPFQSPKLGTFAALIGARVGQDVVVNGTPGSTGDVIGLEDPNAGTGGNIGGNFTANLGQGANQVVLAGTVGKSASVTATNGNNTIFTALNAGVGFQVNGNLTIHLGNGDNTFIDDTTGASGFSSNTNVNGNMNVTLGNGTNDLGTIAASTLGSMSFNLGSGANNPDATLTGSVGTTFYWTSGNGPDTLSIPSQASNPSYNVNIQFGNDDDTLNVGGGAGTVTISGRADGGGRITANTFNQFAGAILTNFQLSNFP